MRTPLKGSPLSHDYVVPALPEGEPSLPCQRGSVIKPNPVTPFGWGSFLKPTPWSRLPARALVASGDRSAPTEPGAETGRWTRATGTQPPPLIPPHDTKFSPSEEAIYRGGPRGQRPLENPIKSKKENPPPAQAREQLSPWFGRGRGVGGWGGWHRRPGKSLHKGRSGILRMSFPTLALAWKTAPRKPRRVSEANG